MTDISPREQERRQLLAWLFEQALPLWSTVGVDRARWGFFEKLTPDGIPTEDPRRARVLGRQIFSFATAAKLGWDGPARDLVRHGLDALEARYFDANGLVRSVIDADGKVLVGTFDLYDHAFVLFGLAAAHAAGERPAELAARARTLLARMRSEFAHPTAGFEESQPRTLPLKANPHMHIFEASLAWSQTSPDPEWLAQADEIAELCLARFLDPATGALREFYDGDWTALTDHEGSVVEPGHQFEWAWLLIRWGLLRRRRDAIAAARRLIDLAETKGVDTTRGLAINELNADLTVRDDRARLWPQTERIKAFTALAGIAETPQERAFAEAKVAEAARGLMRFFVHPVPGAWWEHIGADGKPIVEPSRASSLYHIICAIDVMTEG
ncbi:AGE family epimerase/isomerase [Xanthobacter sp. DSM 24535]|uniref:AGE family epimerase/isomerase n=1 Tax=Roseixanthobacter psychrophilus TaxID=3119917 RepID=UPI00372A7A04